MSDFFVSAIKLFQLIAKQNPKNRHLEIKKYPIDPINTNVSCILLKSNLDFEVKYLYKIDHL